MAVINRGILGGGRGRVGNVVMSSHKGQAILKSLPLSVANPNTTGQQTQRGKFGGAVTFFKRINSQWTKPLWDRFSGGISGFNAIMKANIAEFNSSGVATYANLKMSVGKMVAPSFSTHTAVSGTDTITVDVVLPTDTTWGMAGETAFVCVYNATQNYFLVGTGTGDPTDTVAVVITDTKMVASDALKVWAAIKRTDGTQVSNSIYTTITVS